MIPLYHHHFSNRLKSIQPPFRRGSNFSIVFPSFFHIFLKFFNVSPSFVHIFLKFFQCSFSIHPTSPQRAKQVVRPCSRDPPAADAPGVPGKTHGNIPTIGFIGDITIVRWDYKPTYWNFSWLVCTKATHMINIELLVGG